MSWQSEIERRLEDGSLTDVSVFILEHPLIPQRSIRRHFDAVKKRIANRLRQRRRSGVESSDHASLNTPERQRAKGQANTPQQQRAKGQANTPVQQRVKGVRGGHANSPAVQSQKGQTARAPGLAKTARRELFAGGPSRTIYDWWVSGLPTLYSPLFDAMCHRCGQLLWGPVNGSHKHVVLRTDSAVRVKELFGVEPKDQAELGIDDFRNKVFRNFSADESGGLPPAEGRGERFRTYAPPPVFHNATQMYSCRVCKVYGNRYDPINYGYTRDGVVKYDIPAAIAELTEYEKRQAALGAMYSNTLKRMDLRTRTWQHSLGTVGVARKPSKFYNALYGFMTMKESVLRDYQKPEDTEHSNRRLNKALTLLKQIHPLYGRFLSHYETLYRYVQNAASTMGTLTKKSFADKYGKRLEYHLQGKYVAWAVECDVPRNIVPDFSSHQDKVGYLHESPYVRCGGAVATAAQSLKNDTDLHFNDPKLEACVWPDLYPGGVGGYDHKNDRVPYAMYARLRYLAFDERWRRNVWWPFFQVSRQMKNNLIWNQQNFKAQRGDRTEDITAAHLRGNRSSSGPKVPRATSANETSGVGAPPETNAGREERPTDCTPDGSSPNPRKESSRSSPSSPSHRKRRQRARHTDGVDQMEETLRKDAEEDTTGAKNPYARFGAYVPSNMVGTRSYWSSRHLDLIAMSRKLGKAHLFVTITMNDDWPDLQAAMQEGSGAKAQWPGDFPQKGKKNVPPQTGFDAEACAAWHKRVEMFRENFLSIGKKGPFGIVRDYWYRYEYQERGRVHLHCAVWCVPDSIPDDVICATMPRESHGLGSPEYTEYLRNLYKQCNMLHTCFPDRCYNVGHNRVIDHCKSGFPFETPQLNEELDEKGVRMLYRREEEEDRWVVPHNRALLVFLQCHNNVQRITSLGWELYLTKYLCKASKTLTVPVNLSPDASDVEKLLKLRSLGRMENGMILLGLHQCRSSRDVRWIPTDPWPKMGTLKRKKHLPTEDNSADVFYLDKYELYLERPDVVADVKYPDYYRFFRKRTSASDRLALQGNPAEEFTNLDASSDDEEEGISEGFVASAGRFDAEADPESGARPYWWPDPPAELPRVFTDVKGNRWSLRRRPSIPRWNFYLPYGDDAEKHYLQKILLSSPFGKEAHDAKFLSPENDTRTYMEECIIRGLFSGYEDEAQETLNTAQARGYSIERLRVLAATLHAEEVIGEAFFTSYNEELEAMAKHRLDEEDFSPSAEEGHDPDLAEELQAFMDAEDQTGARALVDGLNGGQRALFDTFVRHMQQTPVSNIGSAEDQDASVDVSIHTRASHGSRVPQLCAIVTGVGGTGKSHVVRLLIAKIRALGFSILVCGSSGVAAINIGGRTIHSLFSLSLDLEWQVKEGTMMWWMIRNADMLIIDEFSMLSSSLLGKLDEILRAVRIDKRNPFGGVTVVLVGDPLQLPSIDEDIFDRPLFRKHFVPFVLTEVMRQTNRTFIDVLNRVRLGEQTEDDHQLLSSRVFPNKDVTLQDLGDAPMLVGRRVAMARWNDHFLAQMTTPVVSFPANDTDMGGGPLAESMRGYIDRGKRRVLPPELSVTKGMRGRLIRNVSMENRLVNSTMVVVKRWSNDVIVISPLNKSREFPICRFQQVIPVHGPTIQVKRLQFPIVAGWSATVHSVQGSTHAEVFADMDTFFAPGHAYVAFSRCETLEGLHILNYSRDAFKVDPYYIQLWNWFVAKNVLAPFPAERVPAYPTRMRTESLVTALLSINRVWQTLGVVPAGGIASDFLKMSPRFLTINMLVVMQYISFSSWSYVDRQIRNDKLTLDVDGFTDEGVPQKLGRGRPKGCIKPPPAEGLHLLDEQGQPQPFTQQQLGCMTLAQLRVLCGAYGLAETNGTKAVLGSRIFEKQLLLHVSGAPCQPVRVTILDQVSFGDFQHLAPNDRSIPSKYWAAETSDSEPMNVRFRSLSWLKAAAVHCLMEVVKPPNGERLGVVLQDNELLHLLRDVSQTNTHFPKGRCTPLLLTGSEGLTGVHYVLLTAVDTSDRVLVVHDSKGPDSKCGRNFKAMLHRLGWKSHWNYYGTQRDDDSCGFRAVFMAMQLWCERRVTGQLPWWFVEFSANALQMFASKNTTLNNTIDSFEEGYFEDTVSWYDDDMAKNINTHGGLPTLTREDYIAAKEDQRAPSKPNKSAQTSSAQPKAPPKQKKPHTTPTRKVPKDKKKAMPPRSTARDVPPTRSRAGKANRTWKGDSPPHKRTHTGSGPKGSNKRGGNKQSNRGDNSRRPDEDDGDEEAENEEDADGNQSDAADCDDSDGADDDKGNESTRSTSSTVDDDTSRGRGGKRQQRKRRQRARSPDGKQQKRRRTMAPLDLASATEVELDRWIDQLGRSDGARPRSLARRVLGTSIPDEARKSYRKLAIQFHPDKNTQDPLAIKRFQLLKPSLEAIK